MRRVIKDLRVDGHLMTVVEVMEEEGPSYVLVTEDGSAINVDQPFPVMPTDAEVRDIFRRWRDNLNPT